MKSNIFSHDFQVLKQLYFLGGIYFRNQKKLLMISLVLGFFAETLAMLMPHLTGNLAETLNNWQQFRRAAFLFLGVGLIQFLFAVTNEVFDRLLKDRLERDAYSFIHAKLLTMDPEYYQRHTHGELLLNINSSPGIAYELLELICFPIFYGGGMVVGLIVLFHSLRNIHLPMWLVVALVAGMAIQPFQTWFFGKLIAKAFTKVRDCGKTINEEILNDLHAPVELRIMYAVRQRIRKMFSLRHMLARRMDTAMLLHIASRYSMSLLILMFQFAIVISILNNYSLRGTVIRDLIASILLIPLMFNHLNKLQQMYNGVKDQEPYITAVYDVFRQKNEIPDGCLPFPSENDFTIDLTDISFAYADGKNVLSRLNMEMRSGLIHAVAAPAGEGKSTILKLIGRLYLPQGGGIRIGGRDIFALNEESFRKHCVICSQFLLFIKGSIRQNFQLQRNEIKDEEIVEACRITGFSSALRIAPGDIPGFEISLGADNLSGGQRKLLALARCFACHPSILLLDEPSAGVDGPTISRYIIPAIRKIGQNMTVVIVDHNMFLIAETAEQVYVLSGGCVAEHGPPEELLKKSDSKFSFLYAQCSKNTIT
ncbi:MAG: ABC transporter ATP-binding protein/permease [Lentisphaeria bacterium]|nr:ABC transporter ATP-binding protein/permease [Lentisphaeria bacterium]